MWFSAAYALGQDGMWLTVYVRLSGVINRKKNRIEEKGGIVRKAKGRRKIEMEIAKKMKGNFQGIFFLWNNLLTAHTEFESIFYRRV